MGSKRTAAGKWSLVHTVTLLALLGVTFWGCREAPTLEPTEIVPPAVVATVPPPTLELSEVPSATTGTAAPKGTLEPTEVVSTAAPASQPPATLNSGVPLPTATQVLRESGDQGQATTPEPRVPSLQATDGPSIHRRDSYDYQKLDSEIAGQVSLFENYPDPRIGDGSIETLAYFPVMVSIDLVGDSRSTFKLLEEHGVSYVRNAEDGTCVPPPSSYCLIPQYNGEHRMDAEISVSILAPLSLQPDVKTIKRWAAFPNLELPVKDLFARYKTGLNPYWFSDRVAGLRPADVSVAICWQVAEDDANTPIHIKNVVDWLKANGAHPNAMLSYNLPYTDLPADPSTIRIYELASSVPLSVLPRLSSQVGNARVTGGSCETSGHEPDGYFPFCCWDSFDSIVLGGSQDFVLLSNPTVVEELLLELEEGDDGGKAAIGNCDNAGSDTLILGHGDTVAMAACTPGMAKIKLFDGYDVVWEGSLSISMFDPNRPILQQVPPFPNAPGDTGIYSVYHLGETITLRLIAPNAGPDGFRVGINEENYTTDTTDTGNLSFGDCPGEAEGSIRMLDGDTVTVTTCSPGLAAVTAWYWDEWNPQEVNSPFGMSVWGPPDSYPEKEP